MLVSLLSFVSLLPSTLALADAPKPRPRSYRGFPAVWVHRSCDQILVHQPPPGRAVNEAIQPQQRVPRDVPIIEPEGELVNIPAQMLRANVVEGSIDAALQDGPDAFDAVRRNAITGVFARAVVDRLVLECL